MRNLELSRFFIRLLFYVYKLMKRLCRRTNNDVLKENKTRKEPQRHKTNASYVISALLCVTLDGHMVVMGFCGASY